MSERRHDSSPGRLGIPLAATKASTALVDDHPTARRGFVRALAGSAPRLTPFESAEELADSAQSVDGFQSYVLDAQLGGQSGIDVAVDLLAPDPTKLVMIVSGHRDLRIEAVERGIPERLVFDKPLHDNKKVVFELVAANALAWEKYVMALRSSDALIVKTLNSKQLLDGQTAFVSLKRVWRGEVLPALLAAPSSPRAGMAIEFDRLLHTRSLVTSASFGLSSPTREELISLRAALARLASSAFTLEAHAWCQAVLEEAGWSTGLEIEELR